MANIKKLMKKLKDTPQEKETLDERIELAFEIITLYSNIQKKTKSDTKECCRAAVILSGYIKNGLGVRTKKFLDEKDGKLPDRAVQVLWGNIRRMESM